ncbi:MAG: IS630 family transposase, partial [bacterium]|nr:IS630 family transposase [bacterium]
MHLGIIANPGFRSHDEWQIFDYVQTHGFADFVSAYGRVRAGREFGVPRGSRPRQPLDQRYENAYLFGAICPERGTGAALTLPYCDTQAMNLHLQEIAQAVAPRAHALVVLDRAPWHRAGTLQVPENITLALLPPRSPELNPVENVWQFLRQNWLSNRVFDTYEDVIVACCNAWNNL